MDFEDGSADEDDVSEAEDNDLAGTEHYVQVGYVLPDACRLENLELIIFAEKANFANNKKWLLGPNTQAHGLAGKICLTKTTMM